MVATATNGSTLSPGLSKMVMPLSDPIAMASGYLFKPKFSVDPKYEQYYPSNWPHEMPFHEGEIAMQKAFDVHDSVMSYAPSVVRPYLPPQHAHFYANQPFLVVAARDVETGDMWSTLLMNYDQDENYLVADSPAPNTLRLFGRPAPGDALEGTFRGEHGEIDVGILGIEFATKRRNRVNGRLLGNRKQKALHFHVDQSFGNCPQYIQPRKWWKRRVSDMNTSSKAIRSTHLSTEQMNRIRAAETIFVATGYRGNDLSPENDVRFGNDSSHRGGSRGFIQVVDNRTIVLPEFAGNNHMNTLGNILMDDRMGVTVPDLENGGLIQMTGHAAVYLSTESLKDDNVEITSYPGALRYILLRIAAVNQVPDETLPIQFSAAPKECPLRVSKIVQESTDVKSFYLTKPDSMTNITNPRDGISPWNYSAGQHLPIRLETPTGELTRTYSLSSADRSPETAEENPSNLYFRISVKKQGRASRFLHDFVQEGDIIFAQPPAGDFVLSQYVSSDYKSVRPLVLLSAGIGITPILAMLEEAISMQMLVATHRRPIYWVHGARDGLHHPFSHQVNKLIETHNADVTVHRHISYSQPRIEDTEHDSIGRVDVALLRSLLGETMPDADYYMCGPGSFLADIASGLVSSGVDEEHIRYETF